MDVNIISRNVWLHKSKQVLSTKVMTYMCKFLRGVLTVAIHARIVPPSPGPYCVNQLSV